jgi:hypothetical protein
MNEAYVLSLVALFGVLGLLVIMLLMHRQQRETTRENAAAKVVTDRRLANLEESFLQLPVTRQRMSEAVRDGIHPLTRRLDETDRALLEIRDLVVSVANKVGASDANPG